MKLSCGFVFVALVSGLIGCAGHVDPAPGEKTSTGEQGMASKRCCHVAGQLVCWTDPAPAPHCDAQD